MDESSFYSIDRLVDFGFSLAVATQMANSMNVALGEMKVPGAGNPMQPLNAKQVYVVLDGESAGPFGPSEVSRLISERRVTKETYVWMPGMPDWQLAESVPDIVRLAAFVPPPVPRDAR